MAISLDFCNNCGLLDCAKIHEKKKLNRCMFTETVFLDGGTYIIERCENYTDKKPDPENNNRVYCDEKCQAIVDKINKEKFKGYVRIEKIVEFINNELFESSYTGDFITDHGFGIKLKNKLENGEFE